MEKLYDRIYWANGTTPALNDSNLNSMSKAIDDIDDRVIALAATVMETVPEIIELYEDVEALTANPPYIGANGHWYTWDTETGAYTDSGIDASISVTIADVTAIAPDATPYVTNTGTDTDPIFHLFIPRGQTGQDGKDGQDGQDGVSPEITITTITGGHRITITDADHPSGQSFDVMDGNGTGDMQASTYDPQGAVATAGGIPAYVAGNTQNVTIDSTGTASSSAVHYQRVGIDGVYTEIDGTKYMESSTKTTANNVDTFTFNNSAITPTSSFDVYSDVFGASVVDMVLSTNQLAVSFKSSDNVGTCRLYIK